MVSAASMWMHFHGQMSTQPSHMMHSDWSMCRNCLGLTALVKSSGAISVSVYSPGKLGSGGLASERAISGLLHERTAVGGGAERGARLGGLLAPTLPPQPHQGLADQTDPVDDHGDDVANVLRGDLDLAAAMAHEDALG